MARVSIITPVYNAIRWLPRTLAAVQTQTIEDWEHIIIDDGSTDGSVELIALAAQFDSRIKLLRSERNLGPARARNRGLAAASGRYIAFLDADDLWLPSKLECCLEQMSTLGHSLVYHDYRHMSADGSLLSPVVSGPDILTIRTLHTRRGHGGCLSMVVDRAQVKSVKFPEFKTLHEDFRAWLHILEQGHNGHRVPIDLGRYRISATARNHRKVLSAYHTWLIYKDEPSLPARRAALWWVQYVWNVAVMYRKAGRLLIDRTTVDGEHWRQDPIARLKDLLTSAARSAFREQRAAGQPRTPAWNLAGPPASV